MQRCHGKNRHRVQQLLYARVGLAAWYALQSGGVAQELPRRVVGVVSELLGQVAQDAAVLRAEGVYVLAVPKYLPACGE